MNKPIVDDSLLNTEWHKVELGARSSLLVACGENGILSIMHPVLIQLGPFTVYTYGLFIVIALVVGLFYFWHKLYGKLMPEDIIFDIAFLTIVGGFVGSRLAFVIMHPYLFWPNIFRIFDVFGRPGMVYIGAIVGGLIVLVSMLRKYKLPTKKYVDTAALAVSLGHATGLIGAFFSGVSYGAQTNWFWGVPMVGLPGKRHPTQLLELVLELGIFAFLYRVMHKDHKDGIVAIWYIMLYSIGRVFIEFLRGDSVYWFGIPVMAIVCIASVGMTLLYAKRRLHF